MTEITKERLYEMAARDEIYQLTCNYMRGQDRLDPVLHRSVFWDDAWCSYGIYEGGPDCFVEFAQGALRKYVSTHHFVGQMHIEVEGDQAFGEVYYQAQHRGPDENGVDSDRFISGRYIDRYERRDGIWKMAYRCELVDWVASPPADDKWFAESPMIRGARKPDDHLYQRDKFYRPEWGKD